MAVATALHHNLPSVGCLKAAAGRSSLCVRTRVCSLSLLSLSSRILTQEAAAGSFRRVFGPLRRGGQPQRSTSVRVKVAGVLGVYMDAQNVHCRSITCSPPPPPRRKGPKTRRKPPPAPSCTSSSSRRRASIRAHAHAQSHRPTTAFEHRTEGKFRWWGIDNSQLLSDPSFALSM